MAKTFEEIKVLVRDLPERLQIQTSNGRRKKRMKRFHPMMMEELMHHPAMRETRNPGLPLLILFGTFRDEYPWLYEIGLEYYRAVQGGNPKEIEKTRRALQGVVELVSHSPFFFEMSGGPDDEDSFMYLRHMLPDLDMLLERSIPALRKFPKDTSKDDPLGTNQTS